MPSGHASSSAPIAKDGSSTASAPSKALCPSNNIKTFVPRPISGTTLFPRTSGNFATPPRVMLPTWRRTNISLPTHSTRPDPQTRSGPGVQPFHVSGYACQPPGSLRRGKKITLKKLVVPKKKRGRNCAERPKIHINERERKSRRPEAHFQ